MKNSCIKAIVNNNAIYTNHNSYEKRGKLTVYEADLTGQGAFGKISFESQVHSRGL